MLRCWEFMRCGRQGNGAKVAELGVCPAYERGAGQACWLVAGTFCKGTVQGTHAEKLKNCLRCKFYQQFDLKHRTRVRAHFGS